MLEWKKLALLLIRSLRREQAVQQLSQVMLKTIAHY
jgi:hypothetical protein